MLFTFPSVLLTVTIITVVKRNVMGIVVTITMFAIPSFTQVVQDTAVSMGRTPCMRITHSLKYSGAEVLFMRVFPNAVRSVVIGFAVHMNATVLTTSSLDFLKFNTGIARPS